jgi:YidC/Oxa1 family membrane protein insertase
VLDALASPVGHLLAWIHSALSTFLIPASGPAWAFSIVLLTVTVRLLLFPLFVKQIKSQRRMQELAPKIKELQKVHKGDRETLNTEMMKLYKENNANPISGCLPLLLQLPVFFALFTVIREFKTGADARYGLTAQQLSEGAAAKVFGAPISAAFNTSPSVLADLDANQLVVRVVAAVMVVLMGLSTFYTQRQMIARSGTTDPQQVMVQKLLLYVLPLSFAVSGAIFPIGVLLYWLTTNLWSMGQQAWVIKRMPPVNLTPGATPPAGKGGTATKTKAGKAAPGKPVPGTAVPAEQAPAEDTAAAQEAPAADSGASGATTGAAAAVPSGGSRVSATPPAPVAAPANRRPAGSRKNKSRRGGRR